MRGIWSQAITLALIVQVALISSIPLTVVENDETRHQLEESSLNETAAERRVGYDYPAPSDNLISPYQDGAGPPDSHNDVIESHDEHVEKHHDDHHDPGYWKKKLIWKAGWKKIWKQGKKQVWKPSWKKVWKPYWIPAMVEWKEAWKQIWIPDYKDIWVPGVKKIWKPVWISEWFPSPDHHDHVHESHGWDRSDSNTEDSQIEDRVDDHHDHHDHDPGYWKKKLIWKEGWKKIWQPAKKQIWKPSWKKIWKPIVIPKKLKWKETWKQIWVPDYKDIWIPGVKKIWKPVWISEWFPSPDHHEHIHESHGWDRSDKNTGDSSESGAAIPAEEQTTSTQPQQSTSWQFPK